MLSGLKSEDFDREIRLERDGATVNGDTADLPGAPVVLATVYANYHPLPGSEKFSSSENAATAPVRFRIRWNEALDPDATGGLNPKDYVRFPATSGGKLYDILSAVTMGRREGIEIAALKRADK
jgi:hypothetical protein